MDRPPPTTHQKASRINGDALRYGTFAEVGAGQEVARWFFHVGKASHTVAKSISAYDMAISDAIYGPSDRYVGRQRLAAMLDYEYDLLLARLDARRGDTTQFFAFADTVATASEARHRDGHGWMGVRFQHHGHAPPSEVVLHVRMLEREPAREQEALGILGINLLHGAFYQAEDPVGLIASLRDDLARGRVEIDVIRFSGPAFGGLDNRLMTLQLVQQGFTDAVLFAAAGDAVQAAEVLWGRPVLVERGSFRPITRAAEQMVDLGLARFRAESGEAAGTPVVVLEMSLHNLIAGDCLDHADFLARVDVLGALGHTVMVSTYAPYWRLSEYLRRQAGRAVAFVMGVPTLRRVFDESYYRDLEGGILEAMGRLFKDGVRLYAAPEAAPGTGALVTARDLDVAPHLRHLYAHLLDGGRIQALDGMDGRHLGVYPHDVLALLRAGDPAWQALVPPAAVPLIRDHRLFAPPSPVEDRF